MSKQFYKIGNYSMKCRLYPKEEQKELIDKAIHAVHAAYNMTLHEILEDNAHTTEYIKEDGGILHNVDFKAIANANHLKTLKAKNPAIGCVPPYAIYGQNGVFCKDLFMAMCHKEIIVTTKTGKTIRKHDKNIYLNGKGKPQPYAVEIAKPGYYTEKDPRRSYTYQELASKISRSPKNNRNVFFINLMKIGNCKVRGWNQNIRFGENQEYDFLEWAENNKNKQITITVSKDNCGDYWVVFKLSDVYKQMEEKPQTKTGLDVGVKDIVIRSDGEKYENKKFKRKEKNHLAYLQRCASRQGGWSNIKFRETYAVDKSVCVSKKYNKTQDRIKRLQRKTTWEKENYNHNVTADIINSFGFIGVETLNVSGMFRNHHLAYALSDASMGQILSMLAYKSNWYQRDLVAIDKWTPSSKRCHCCGYIRPKLSLSTREWVCPECRSDLDRDINAAINILYYAELAYTACIMNEKIKKKTRHRV